MTDLYTAVAEAEQEPPPDPETVRAIWDDAVAAPGWEGPPLWLHGDLHPANVLTADGNFCGVVDFGDLCAGDPALDLAACWILLPDHEAIERLQSAYPPARDERDLAPCPWLGRVAGLRQPPRRSGWSPRREAELGPARARLPATSHRLGRVR